MRDEHADLVARLFGELAPIVADQFGVTVEELVGPNRRQPLARARQIVMAAMYGREERPTLVAIASHFHRSHPTALHAIAAAVKFREQHPKMQLWSRLPDFRKDASAPQIPLPLAPGPLLNEPK